MKQYTLHSFLLCIIGGILFFGCNKEPLKKDNETNSDFSFETTELTQGSFGVKITPNAKEQTYYFGIITKSDYALFSSPEEFQAYDVDRIKQLAEDNDVDLEQFLMEALLKGDQEWTYTALSPETDYIFYAYGLSTDCQIQTILNTYSFKTPAVSSVDIEFEITITNLKPTSFTLNVKPSRDDCSYYYDVITPDQYNEYKNDLKAFVEAFLYDFKKTDAYKSYSMAQFIDEVTSRGKITDDSFENLLPEGTYHALAVAVANDGTCMSEVEVKTFQTSESPKNEYTVSSESVTDVSYSAVINASESEAFAVMMELQEYFNTTDTDSDIIEALYNAHNQDISEFLHADMASVGFNHLIPNDKYYLFIFACNPDGSPKLDAGKVNLKKIPICTKKATMSDAVFNLSLGTTTKNSIDVTVTVDESYNSETFLINYIKETDYNAIEDKTSGLKKHMDAFIEAKVKNWNETHGESSQMTRKEFLSRSLLSGDNGDTYAKIEMTGLDAGTKYRIYLMGLKADGTYTTVPVVTEVFETVADQQCMASLSFDATAYGYPSENRDMYMVYVFPEGDCKEYFVKSFSGTDEWSGKPVSEIKELLKKETSKVWGEQQRIDVTYGQTWYMYGIVYDNHGFASSIYKIEHTSPIEGGDGKDLNGRTIKLNVETINE